MGKPLKATDRRKVKIRKPYSADDLSTGSTKGETLGQASPMSNLFHDRRGQNGKTSRAR